MKRRMQRFLCSAAVALSPGQEVLLGDGRAAQVVDAVAADGGTELLAVAPRPGAASGESPAANEELPGAARGAALECHPLPLPYAFPD